MNKPITITEVKTEPNVFWFKKITDTIADFLSKNNEVFIKERDLIKTRLPYISFVVEQKQYTESIAQCLQTGKFNDLLGTISLSNWYIIKVWYVPRPSVYRKKILALFDNASPTPPSPSWE